MKPSTDRVLKMQIDEWLRKADIYIREGRYIAADEMLQKVFAVHPENEVAFNYEARIQFLINQLSQRVGLNKDTHMEIRRYRDLYIQRKTNRVTSLLTTAAEMVEDGYLKKAFELVNKAMTMDQANTYAKALLQRIMELQHQASVMSEHEMQFRSLLKESWHNGRPLKQQEEILSAMQTQLKVTDEKRKDLERDVKNALYKDSLAEIWHTGGLAAFNMEMVEQLRQRYELSRLDHALIERSLLKEVRKNKVRGTVLIVESDEQVLLELTKLLRTNSYAVIAAGTFEEALTAARTVQPDAVISEVKYADGMLGFDLFEFIRSESPTADVPFIFVTSALDRTTRIIGKRLGVDEFMTKPIDSELLIATITGVLHRKGSRSSTKH